MRAIIFTFLISFSAFGFGTPMQQKVAEALLKTETLNKYRGNTEKYALKELKKSTSINKDGVVTLAAIGYTAATGRIDTAKFIKARIRVCGSFIFPAIVYDLRETSGALTFMINIPF